MVKRFRQSCNIQVSYNTHSIPHHLHAPTGKNQRYLFQRKRHTKREWGFGHHSIFFLQMYCLSFRSTVRSAPYILLSTHESKKAYFHNTPNHVVQIIKGNKPYKHWTFSGWATLEHRNMLMFFLDIRLNITLAWFSLTQQMQRKVYMIIIWGCVPGLIFAEHSFSKLETDCIRVPQKS